MNNCNTRSLEKGILNFLCLKMFIMKSKSFRQKLNKL